jgi:nucleotide-binding universal stress UspA family protein
MFRTMLVPVDGSELAESALAYATRIAAPVDGSVILLRAEALIRRRRPRVVSAAPASTSWLAPADPTARMTLEAAAARAQADGVMAEVDFQRYRLGRVPAADAILDAVRERRPDLVVVSTRGRSGLARWRHGSVADELVRGADVPVLLVPASVRRPWPVDRALRVLVPLDGSKHAEEILDPAGRLADQLGAELHLLRVVEPLPAVVRSTAPHSVGSLGSGELAEARDYLARVLDRVRRTGMVVTARAVVGNPPASIAAAACEADVDLIAMATHGRGGLMRLIMGSVAAATLQRASVPLLLVRPGIAGRRMAAAEAVAQASVEGISPLSVTVLSGPPEGPRRAQAP